MDVITGGQQPGYQESHRVARESAQNAMVPSLLLERWGQGRWGRQDGTVSTAGYWHWNARVQIPQVGHETSGFLAYVRKCPESAARTRR